MTRHFINNLWRWKCNIPELPPTTVSVKYTNLDDVLKQNWCAKFIQLMKNRMILGFFRYGPMDKKDGKYDNIGSIKKRIALYEKCGNDEILVDCANLCMCEFVNGDHPKKHFKAVDDGIHTEKR